MCSRILTLFVALGATSAPALAQLVVGPVGSGAPFDEISAALAVAQPGELILVQAGEYGPIVVDKAVTILGAGADSTFVRGGSTDTSIEVTGLAAGEVARLVGLSVDPVSGIFGEALYPLIDIDGNAGLVALQSVSAIGGGPLPFAGDALVRIDGSAQVSLEACELVGVGVGPLGSFVPPQNALRIDDSSVSARDCRIVGGGGGLHSATPPSPGATALVAVDSDVVLARSAVIGGDGGVNFDPMFGWVAAGGDGAVLIRSRLLGYGGEGSEVRGGDGVAGDFIGGFYVSAGGVGLRLDAECTARLASDLPVGAGLDGDGVTAQPAIDAADPLQLTLLAHPLPTLAVDPGQASLPGTVTLVEAGNPGAAHFSFFSTVVVPAYSLPGLAEAAVLDPSGAQALTTVNLDATGQASTSFALPAQPALVGLAAHAQAIEVGSAGTFLSNPATLVFGP